MNCSSTTPSLSNHFVLNFLKEKGITKQGLDGTIQSIYQQIHIHRNQAIKENKLKFKCVAEINAEDLPAFKIFESIGMTLVEKEKEEKTNFEFFRSCDFSLDHGQFRDLAEGSPTIPSKLKEQKFDITLNFLDKYIYKVIKDNKKECDDRCYISIYESLKEMMLKGSEGGFKQTNNVRRSDIPLFDLVLRSEGISREKTEYFISQKICLKGRVNNPNLMGINEKPMPPFPQKNKRELDPTFRPDIVFSCQGVEIPMHIGLLGRFDYFKNFLETHNSQEPILMDNFCPKAFKEVQNHVYFKPLSQTCQQDISVSLETSKIARMFMLDELETSAKQVIRNRINVSNFFLCLSYAENERDAYLMDLCNWYASNNGNLDKMIDLTKNSAFQLFQIQEIIEKYGLGYMRDPIQNELTKKFTLDDDFIKIVEFVSNKNEKTNKILDKLLTEQLVAELKLKHKDAYKMQWKAYKNYKL